MDPGTDREGRVHPFAVCLLLGIAYASSIGGMGTIVGTAPNVFVVSYLREQLNIEIGFLEWMRLALPLVALFLPLAWLVLTGFVYKVSNRPIPGVVRLLRDERDKLPPWSRGEALTCCVFILTAVSWISRPLLNKLSIGGAYPLAGLTDSGIAVLAAVILFVVPVNWRRHEFLMDWPTAVRLPWGLLLLFGGGLALAAALVDTGFSAYIGNQASLLRGWPNWAVVMLVTATIVFLTELTSNTATTATFVPILLAVATGLGLAPVILIVPAAFAASCAFMLPVATPPNAIVFGSGLVAIGQMARAGLWLNLIAIFLITAVSYAIIASALGVIV
jgi:sodium-dependent dicarboxylate transporter 2/3/5